MLIIKTEHKENITGDIFLFIKILNIYELFLVKIIAKYPEIMHVNKTDKINALSNNF